MELVKSYAIKKHIAFTSHPYPLIDIMTTNAVVLDYNLQEMSKPRIGVFPIPSIKHNQQESLRQSFLLMWIGFEACGGGKF